jgi:hypothetical protein
MRKYLSAGDNSIQILCNSSGMENILSYPVKLYTKYFSYIDKTEKCCISIFSIGINDLSIQENIFPALISLNLSYRENVFFHVDNIAAKRINH